MIIPYGDVITAFEQKYPNIDVQAEYHGSIQVIRHVAELHEQIDIVTTADAALIPMLMYATQDAETGKPYASWYLRFATNHMAIAYSPKSKYAGEINADNWYTILSRPDVKVGIADPRFDASGYRALMIYALAQNYYKQPKLFTEMFKGKFNYPMGIFIDEGLATITVPEIIESKSDSNIVIRGASIQLLALLESGDLDYAFEYESVIQQHKLQMVQLPDAINLGSPDFVQEYQKVLVNLDFQRFATVKPEFRGEQIAYGITIPSNAPNPDAAALFIQFLMGPEGQAIMQADHHPMYEAAACDGKENVPAALQPLCGTAEKP